MNLGELVTATLSSSDLYDSSVDTLGTCGTKSVCHIDGTDDGDDAALF